MHECALTALSDRDFQLKITFDLNPPPLFRFLLDYPPQLVAAFCASIPCD